MKTDFQTIKKTSISEVILTVMLLVMVAAMILGGASLTGVVELPITVQRYVGGALLALVVIGGFIIVHNCVKFMLKKGE